MGNIAYLRLSGLSEAKGRNGYFVAIAAELGVQGVNPARARLEVFSKVRGDSPPLVLELAKADAVTIGNALLAAAASMP